MVCCLSMEPLLHNVQAAARHQDCWQCSQLTLQNLQSAALSPVGRRLQAWAWHASQQHWWEVAGSPFTNKLLHAAGTSMEDVIADGMEGSNDFAVARHGIESTLNATTSSAVPGHPHEPEEDSAVVPRTVGHPANGSQPQENLTTKRQHATAAIGAVTEEHVSISEESEAPASTAGVAHISLLGAPFAVIFAIAALAVWHHLGQEEKAGDARDKRDSPSSAERVHLVVQDTDVQQAVSTAPAPRSAHQR